MIKGLLKNNILTIIRYMQVKNMETRTVPEDKICAKWFLQQNKNEHFKDVLDICGGFGLWNGFLKQNGFTFNYTSVDISDDLTSFSHQFHQINNWGPVRFIQHDIHNPLPFLDKSFDQVWMIGWWVAGVDELFFSEAYRVLKDDGILFGTTRIRDADKFKDFMVIERTDDMPTVDHDDFFFMFKARKII